MTTHDPRQVIEDLRGHLAQHDRRLMFLFGAGASCAVTVAAQTREGDEPKVEPLIPAIDGLTETCREAVSTLGGAETAAWHAILEECEEAKAPASIEQILSRVRMKIEAVGKDETLAGLTRDRLCKVESLICRTIARSASPPENRIPTSTPHEVFASWVKKVNRTAPLEVFTTNYDVLIERACENARIPVFDGFVGAYRPFFYPECLEDETQLPSASWIRLWKLHGSVNWFSHDTSGGKRVLRGQPADTGEVILPSHRKYDESRKQPYVAYMDRFVRMLNSEHALLVTSGYSFGDEHINAVIFGALENRSTANVIALQFQDLAEGHELVEAAIARPNLTVLGPNAAVISGIWGTWQLTQPVDSKTHSFMDAAFDSHGLPEEGGSPASESSDLHGIFRLGDFNWFCQFLRSMGDGSK